MIWSCTSYLSAFTPLLARWFTTLVSFLSPRSSASFPTTRDGTDPLCGGHGASHQDHLAGGTT